MISAIYIFSVKGELLLQRVYAPSGPPRRHLKALAQSLTGDRTPGRFAPVICVGSGNSSTSLSDPPAAVSSFTWFMPPRTGAGGGGCSSPLALSAASSPATNNAANPALGQGSGACPHQGARRRYGARYIDEQGVIYVAALHHNGNVACALEVLRRLAALVQAFFTAAVQAGSSEEINSHFTGELALAPSSRVATSRPQRGVSVDACASGKRIAEKDAQADATTRAKSSPSSWQKIKRGLSVPREALAESRGDKHDIMGTSGALMPVAPISPVTCDYTYRGSGDAERRADAGNGSVSESFIRNNFVLLHELLDEAVDGGVPQLLDLTALKQFIFLGSSRSAINVVGSLLPTWAADLLGAGGRASGNQPSGGGAAFGSSSSGPRGGLNLKRGDRKIGALQDVLQSRKITMQVTSACAWRSPDIKYRSNEVYVDVVECVNVLISQSGVVLHADVQGQVLVNCKLSGMPECKFGLNERCLGGGAGSQSGSGNAGTESASDAAARRHLHASQQQQQPASHPASQTAIKEFSGQAVERAAALGPGKLGPSAGGQKRAPLQQQRNDPKRTGGVALDDCRFHQCVKLTKYESERIVTFVPPDGVFQLMSYRYVATSLFSLNDGIGF